MADVVSLKCSNISQLRKHYGLSVLELADIAGVRPSTIEAWEAPSAKRECKLSIGEMEVQINERLRNGLLPARPGLLFGHLPLNTVPRILNVSSDVLCRRLHISASLWRKYASGRRELPNSVKESLEDWLRGYSRLTEFPNMYDEKNSYPSSPDSAVYETPDSTIAVALDNVSSDGAVHNLNELLTEEEKDLIWARKLTQKLSHNSLEIMELLSQDPKLLSNLSCYFAMPQNNLLDNIGKFLRTLSDAEIRRRGDYVIDEKQDSSASQLLDLIKDVRLVGVAA